MVLLNFQHLKTPDKISRRAALQKTAAAVGALALPQILRSAPEKPFKIAIKNGQVFTGRTLEKKWVGVKWDGTLTLSDQALEAENVLDATGKIVSPGFIDILADNASNPQKTFQTFEKYKLTDGLTTVLELHGGAASPAAFHRYMDTRPHAVNYGVGVFVMVIRNQTDTLANRLKLVEKALEEGGLAVCHSIEYQPTDYAEVKEYAKLAKKYDRPMFLHLRYSSQEKELEGVKEAIQLAKETGARIHIDHLHSTGGTYQMPQALDLIEQANQSGQEITICVYPYSYWATYLASKRFDEGWQQRFHLTYEDLTIVGTGEKITAQTFARYRAQPGLLVATPEGTMPFEKTINLALQKDFCMIASDGGLQRESKANNHPRGAACFATAVRHGLNIGLGMVKTLSKVTTLPAQLMRPVLQNRGVIANGKIADLTIFNPETINGKASVANPNQYSEGIDFVILNGELVYRNKEIVANAGRPIRYT